MKKLLLSLTLLFCIAPSEGGPMSRVISITDSRTLVVDTAGKRESVTLRGVDLAPDEEAAAVDFLRRLVSDTWVYVEKGDVYRSPDALFVNGEMIRHAWRTATSMKYLGELDLDARKKTATRSVKTASPKLLAPPPRPRVTSRTSSRPKRKSV
jgi:hypothetical protein